MSTVLAQKAPADVVEYTITIEGLGSDAIAAVSVVADVGGVSIPGSPAPSFTPSTVTFWTTGGRLGFSELVTLTVTTTGGRTFARLLAIPIRAL